MLRKIALTLLGLAVFLYLIAWFIPIEPLEQRPGTRLSGNPAPAGDADFSTLAPRTLVFVQANTWYGIPHSVTTTSMVHQGELYVPCGWCATKRWPKLVADDPNVIVKVNGVLHNRVAERVTDTALKNAMFAHHDFTMDGVELYHMKAP